MPGPRDLVGASVLVAGASGVLGGELSRSLHRAGARVALAGRDKQRLEAKAAELGDAPVLTFDIRSPQSIDELIDNASSLLGGLHGVVNAVGVVAFGPLTEMSDQALEEIMEVNLIGPLRLMRSASAHLENGFLVNLTGVVAESPVAGLTAYSASKAGLSAASVALARELRSQGTTVLDARPPHTETGLVGRAIEGSAPRLPEGKDPGAVAQLVVEAIRSRARQLATAEFD